MKLITFLTVFLVFIVIIAQATPTPNIYERTKKEKIGKNLYLDGVSFQDSYRNVATKLIKVHHQYNSLFSSFGDSVKAAAKKDKLPVPEFFTEWNDNYVEKAKEAHQIYLVFIAKLESFKKKLDEAYKGK
ncbi:8188_t:CDS:1 [Diversispora eburnea]|uniref:8188_t:CDS:1 n=1 Tax=Diversispora eburnea TaxID=1213867 RepID=A0A9N9B551_9GLOM|nr:8188_t:CDS:1 [Diversispora eburnea]